MAAREFEREASLLSLFILHSSVSTKIAYVFDRGNRRMICAIEQIEQMIVLRLAC